MSGVNSHTHDPIAIGGQLDWGTKEVFKCELCCVEMPEEALTSYDGYKACSECIESSEKEKQQESDFLNAKREGRTELAIQLLNELEGDTRRIVLETISKLQA